MKTKITSVALAILISSGLASLTNVAIAQTGGTGVELEEIIVTARGRDESIQSVPISETVYTAQSFEDAGINQVDDFLALTPGVTFANSQDSGTNFISIRGLSQVRNGEAPVAVVVDDVLQVNSRSFDQPLFDVASIEVLRGPQGALYGRNATGGAIIINTKPPSEEKTEGYVQVGAGDGGEFNLEGSVSGKLSDTVSGRISAKYRSNDGLLDNFITGDGVDFVDELAVRGHLRIKASEAVTIDLRASVVDTDGSALNFSLQSVVLDPNTGLIAGFDGVLDADLVQDEFAANNVSSDEREVQQFSLRINADLGFANFRSVTAIDRIEQENFGDQFPYTQANSLNAVFGDGIQSQFVDITTFSQEFRLSSYDDQDFRWSVGAYLLDTDRFINSSLFLDLGNGLTTRSLSTPVFDPLSPQISFIADQNDNLATALFFNLEYDVNDKLEVAFAGRYDRDDREQRVDPLQGAFANGVNVGPIGVPGSLNEEEFSLFQPKFTIRYTPNDNLNLYGSWGVGFRSGQFNQNGVAPLAAAAGVAGVEDLIDQEETTTFELGAKYSWAGGRYTLNGSLYNTDVENAPYFVFIGAVGAQVLVPINEIDVTGGEIEFSAAFSDAWSFYASASVTDTEIEEYIIDPSLVGNEAPYIADSTFNIGLQYRAPISAGLTFFARGDYEVRGEQFWDPENSTARSAVELANFRVGLEGNEGVWAVTASVENAFDELYNSEWVGGGFAHAGLPRFFQVQARYNF